MNDTFSLDPKFVAGVEMLRRTGMTHFRIGYTDDDDGPPIVWHCTASWGTRHEADASLDPVEALMRLCERAIDGGSCTHCGTPTIFVHDLVDPGGLTSMGCVYAWDPELKTFRRGCE
jgi:hypothetical protein